MKIEADKWKHFYAGNALGFLLSLAGVLAHLEFTLLFLLVFIIIVLVSFGFELFSLVTQLGHFDIWDAVATIIGGLMSMAICMLFFH